MNIDDEGGGQPCAITGRSAWSKSVVFPLIGFAILANMAFDGMDLSPLWDMLNEKIADGSVHPGEIMDLSLIAQLLGSKQQGLSLQDMVLANNRLFRSPCHVDPPGLRVLAIATPTDIGGNTPIEFLLEGSDIELTTLYVLPGTELPSPLPAHDVAIVIASESGEREGALAEVERVVAAWTRPVLNPPRLIMQLERDRLYRVLDGIEGLIIPATVGVAHSRLIDVAEGHLGLKDLSSDLAFPVIIRPRGSHAGRGLAKIDDCEALRGYLSDRSDDEFFVARFVDYSDDRGTFRKYRIVAVEGRFFACHMAIADQWDIWYLNAGMLFDAGKRAEEAAFMQTFDEAFAVRHGRALSGMMERVGLDYFTVDCAEDRDGNLLIFEVDNTAVVHNMDPADIYPYKGRQMHAIFKAFAAMLTRAARQQWERAQSAQDS